MKEELTEKNKKQRISIKVLAVVICLLIGGICAYAHNLSRDTSSKEYVGEKVLVGIQPK